MGKVMAIEDNYTNALRAAGIGVSIEDKYNKALRAGTFGGVILAALLLLMGLLNQLNMSNVSMENFGSRILGAGALLFLLGILFIVVPIVTGAYAVRMTAATFKNSREAFVISALAGAVAGVIFCVVQIILSFLGNVLSDIAGSLNSAIFTIVCCLPVTIVYTVVLAIIGGALYATYYPFYPKPVPGQTIS